MPVEGPDSNVPHTSGSSGTTGGPDSGPLGGTVEQVAPPSWALSDGTPASGTSQSGKALYDLDREIAQGGADVAEGYTLVQRLGTGSFGTVWEAQDRLTGERVAIKFFTAGDADWAKLLGEVGLLQAVEGCRGIVMVKQVRTGGPGCRPHYAMQLANSGSLADWLKSAPALPPRERVRQVAAVFLRVARAMAAVHRRGIHHCDLKPHNILLHRAEPGAEPEPLVADFGQAHLATDDTPALGTFFYMPPDQIEAAQAGTPPDTRWDVYALGAVAYEMLTGEPPRRSPELTERIKKAPKHLPTKMAVYREGIMAAARPEAHRRVADPLLVKIIDRCLNLRSDRRPADAGALVALLEARARWRRTRPLLALAAVATLLLVSIVASAGALAAKAVTVESEQNVTTELAASLARTAGYSVPAVERRLQNRVKMVETAAERAPDSVRAALARLGRGPHGDRLDPAAVPLDDREAFAAWLKHILDDRHQTGASPDGIASITLFLVADAAGPGGSRGFIVARAHPDGTVERAAGADRSELFTRDFSFRDYFHGAGTRAGDEGKPHPVIRTTHICNPYRSQSDDRTSTGKRIPRPWKVDAVTPIWDTPGGRVVGLLSFGLHLDSGAQQGEDIVSLLEPVDLGARGSAKLDIAGKVKVVLVDDRNNWVWHPDCKGRLKENSSGMRLPHDYHALAVARGLDPAAALPWLGIGAPEEGLLYGYARADRYVDLVEAHHEDAEPNVAPEIACFTLFHPYALSQYEEVRARRWVFVAQVDRKTALAPLNDLRASILKVGAVAGSVLTLIAFGLWVGLVVVLRRVEFASHG